MSFDLHYQKTRDKGFKFTDKDIEDAIIIDDKSGVIPNNEYVLMAEYHDGQQSGSPCMIEPMTKNFSWKKNFQNCWTGYPNDGKSTFVLFLMVIKSLVDGWKWCIWSPEMISSQRINGRIIVNANDLINEIVWMVTGLTPYKHIEEKYLDTKRIVLETYQEAYKWVFKHFVFLNPSDKTPEGLIEIFYILHDKYNFDGFLIDPFKNIKQNSNDRYDIWLESVFAQFKNMANDTYTSMNWVAHPKANVTRVVNGVLQPCTQYMLSGGAAWDNSMDGIYSVFRPNTLSNPRDTGVEFMNLKQRKQELVAERGVVDSVNFNIRTRRYEFKGIDPIDSLIDQKIIQYNFLKKKPKYVDPPDVPSIHALPGTTVNLPYKDSDETVPPWEQ